jgi:uncharacterized hydrophobic protein (TIGR00271 family)
MEDADKPRVYSGISAGSDLRALHYWLEIVFSAGIATFGLVLNSPAVIIGAMLISPLMNPIMATGLALAAGDLYLAFRAIANLLLSIALAVALSAFFVWLLPFHSATTEILSRTAPNLLDLAIALLSGLAGSVAVCRSGGSNDMTTLPGVAIAVALMPPLCALGFGLGSGVNTAIMAGAGLLFLTNIVAIVASAFVVFLLAGMASPEVRAHMREARQSKHFSRKLAASPFGRILASTGALGWRIVMLAILLAALAVPLHKALQQVAGEAAAREAVQSTLKKLLPPGALVSQQVQVGPESIAIHLFSTQGLPPEKLRAAEAAIERSSHRSTRITLAGVASQNELAQLSQRLAAEASTPPPPPPPPQPTSLQQTDTTLLARITPLVQAAWPAEAPLQSYNLAFGSAGTVLSATYTADKPLPPVALDLLTATLRDKLGDPTLTLVAHQAVVPAKSAAKKPSGLTRHPHSR